MEEKKETEFDRLNNLLGFYNHLTELQLVNLMHLKKAKLRRVQSPEDNRDITEKHLVVQARNDNETGVNRDRTEKHLVAIYRALNQKKPKK